MLRNICVSVGRLASEASCGSAKIGLGVRAASTSASSTMGSNPLRKQDVAATKEAFLKNLNEAVRSKCFFYVNVFYFP
jgi:hypothetical protein